MLQNVSTKGEVNISEMFLNGVLKDDIYIEKLDEFITSGK